MRVIKCNTCSGWGHFACQCSLPNPDVVPARMTDTSGCPPNRPTPKRQPPPAYTIPVPKQATMPPPRPLVITPNDNALTKLTVKINALINQHSKQNKFLKQVHAERLKLNNVESTKNVRFLSTVSVSHDDDLYDQPLNDM